MPIHVKRAYEPPAQSDGRRVLVDRVWPRGIKKEDLRLDDWVRDVAPSTALRKWYNHDRAKWDEFKKRYFEELDAKPQSVDRIRRVAAEGTVTLVFSAKDSDYNNAVALSEYVERRYDD